MKEARKIKEKRKKEITKEKLKKTEMRDKTNEKPGTRKRKVKGKIERMEER